MKRKFQCLAKNKNIGMQIISIFIKFLLTSSRNGVASAAADIN